MPTGFIHGVFPHPKVFNTYVDKHTFYCLFPVMLGGYVPEVRNRTEPQSSPVGTIGGSIKTRCPGLLYNAGKTDKWQTMRLVGAGAEITRGSTSYFSVFLCRFEIFQIKIFRDRCYPMSPKISLKFFKFYFLYLSF